jgi:cobalt/nickel transport system permease protein
MGVVFFGILTGVASESPAVPFTIALFMGMATVILAKMPLKQYLKMLSWPASFVILSIVIIAFFFGTGEEIFGFDVLGYHLGINTEGIEMAFLVFSRTFGGMSCLFFLALTTPMVELFGVLKKSRLPDSFIEVSMMMYRYIFVFLDIALSIRYAQAVRLGYKDTRTSLNSLAMLTSTLFLRSWEQGEKIFVSMNARCYDGKMAFYEETRPLKVPEVLLSLFYMVVVVVVWYIFNGIGL